MNGESVKEEQISFKDTFNANFDRLCLYAESVIKDHFVAELNISENTVEVQMGRALQKLRISLGEYFYILLVF